MEAEFLPAITRMVPAMSDTKTHPCVARLIPPPLPRRADITGVLLRATLRCFHASVFHLAGGAFCAKWNYPLLSHQRKVVDAARELRKVRGKLSERGAGRD